MAADEKLVERVRGFLKPVKNVEEKRMFRGLSFLVNDKMCINVSGDELMLRFDPAMQQQVMRKPGTRPMIMRGRVYEGYVYVSKDVINTDAALKEWCELALDFNPRAVSSKKVKKKT